MSTVVREKLPQPVARSMQAVKRLRITHAGTTIATVEPHQPVSKASRRLSKKLTAREWIATVGGKLTARPDLDVALIVRSGRDLE